jgi:hypothetical protein
METKETHPEGSIFDSDHLKNTPWFEWWIQTHRDEMWCTYCFMTLVEALSDLEAASSMYRSEETMELMALYRKRLKFLKLALSTVWILSGEVNRDKLTEWTSK